MSGPPPGPGAVIMSGTPSPLTSPTATRTPPVKFLSYAKKLNFTAFVAASNTTTFGPPPASAPVAMIAVPGSVPNRVGTTATAAVPATDDWLTSMAVTNWVPSVPKVTAYGKA